MILSDAEIDAILVQLLPNPLWFKYKTTMTRAERGYGRAAFKLGWQRALEAASRKPLDLDDLIERRQERARG